ncbi:universal stress protein [Herbiconiux sp. SYSU D00978]|uniref:universal stress protein n=1 Tax=Herbiconiux sp. SYSU D00978 TaxID=2812562 RepID=UPI001A975C6E|nr:universal stress protein [Herbiconiux sp. SYSU D00978]
MSGTTYYVALDGSRPSSAALDWTLARAEAEHAPVVLVHVVEHRTDRHVERGEALLAGALDAARAGHPSLVLGTSLLLGSVTRSLAGLGGPDDVLVMGTNKTGWLRGRVVGARSVLVASLSRASVAVIPELDLKRRDAVVVGVKHSDAAAPALALAAREARHLGTGLLALHAAPLEPGGPETPGSEGRGDVLAEALALAALDPGLVVETQVVHRAPVDALLGAARQASLLVLGTSRDASHLDSVAGPVAHDVLMNINAPVLIARSSAREKAGAVAV